MKYANRFLTPLDIPAQTVGDYAIQRDIAPPGQKIMMGSIRTAMFGQGAHKDLSYDHPTTWHQLLHDGVRIMSDWPVEQRQINANLKGFSGRVLVGGLGLGYAATVLLKRKTVKSVTVVEVSSEVIDMVKPFTKDPDHKLTVVHANLFDYLKHYDGPQFDRAFYDIWSSDGEGTFHHVVVPLYNLSAGTVKRLPVNWNEDIMRGQLYNALHTRLMLLRPEAQELFKDQLAIMSGGKTIHPWDYLDEENIWHDWAVPFFQWWHETQPTEEKAFRAASFYSQTYGTPKGKFLWKTYIQLGD